MKSLIYSSAIIAILFLYSCSEDNSTNTPASDLNGTWSGEYISEHDTAKYSCTINESKGNISGTGELYGYRKVIDGSRIITDEIRKKTNVEGSFIKPDVQIKFRGDDTYHFSGQLSEDKMSVNGQVSVHYETADTIIDYPVTLIKK